MEKTSDWLENTLKMFSVLTTGNKAVRANPEYAIEYARGEILERIAAERASAQEDLIQRILGNREWPLGDKHFERNKWLGDSLLDALHAELKALAQHPNPKKEG